MGKRQTEVARTSKGQFSPGQSGNPAGRPAGARNMIVELKQNLELAVRQHLPVKAVQNIVDKMAELAMEGNVAAAKLLLDKVISNASGAEEAPESGKTYIFRVENATIHATRDTPKTPTLPALEGDFEEIKR